MKWSLSRRYTHSPFLFSCREASFLSIVLDGRRFVGVVAGGGCSGMQYGMALEAEARNYDHIIEQDGVKVFIDPTSMMYLNHATIDYVDSIMGGGFKIENPNAVTSCGCGSSFKTKESGGYAEAAGGCGCGH